MSNEVIRVGPWFNRIIVLIRSDTRALSLSLCLPYEDTARTQPAASQKERPQQKMNWPEPRYWTSQLPELWENKFLLLKPHSVFFACYVSPSRLGDFLFPLADFQIGERWPKDIIESYKESQWLINSQSKKSNSWITERNLLNSPANLDISKLKGRIT